MKWAAMPKAAIDEHGDPCPREHDVGFSSEMLERTSMYEIPQSLSMERLSERTLGTRVASRLGAHASMDHFGRGKGCPPALSHALSQNARDLFEDTLGQQARDRISDLCLNRRPTADELEGVGEREQSLQLLNAK